MRHNVLAAFLSLPKRGLETGGILLGRINSVGPLSITVEQVEPIACEHPSGPAFILSESDRAQLAQQLSRPRQDDLVSVGCYRSCTGRDLGLDNNDHKMMDEFWPASHHVFLAIQPVSKNECIAEFFVRRHGKLETNLDQPPFALRTDAPHATDLGPSEAATAEQYSPADQQEELVVTGTVHQPVSLCGTDEMRPLRRRGTLDEPERRRPAWTWLVVCLALAIALLVGRELWTSLAEPRWRQLGLNVSSVEAGLEVSWDPSLPEVQNARWGVLAIVENGVASEIGLNRAALARGTFTYRSSGNNVLVRFRVGGTYAGVFGETFRFVSESKPAEASAQNAEEGSTPSNGIEEDAPQPAPGTVATQQPSKADVEVAATDGQENGPEAVRQTPRETKARIVSAATAVHEVQPFVPEGIRGRITERIIVPVTVRIDAAGRVISAEPESDGDTVYRYLASRAVVAAKLWRFEPARSARGTRSASTKTLHFVFAP
jgi:hypothetical protein